MTFTSNQSQTFIQFPIYFTFPQPAGGTIAPRNPEAGRVSFESESSLMELLGPARGSTIKYLEGAIEARAHRFSQAEILTQSWKVAGTVTVGASKGGGVPRKRKWNARKPRCALWFVTVRIAIPTEIYSWPEKYQSDLM
ncbi:hypothetical protein KM043_000135 [Ampulex compressa]|nr:hypothetical protein KM043_000135 [Ampulex compressa]